MPPTMASQAPIITMHSVTHLGDVTHQQGLSNSVLDWFLLRATATPGQIAAFGFLKDEYGESEVRCSVLNKPLLVHSKMPLGITSAPFERVHRRELRLLPSSACMRVTNSTLLGRPLHLAVAIIHCILLLPSSTASYCCHHPLHLAVAIIHRILLLPSSTTSYWTFFVNPFQTH
jgi:hypothetical protein